MNRAKVIFTGVLRVFSVLSQCGVKAILSSGCKTQTTEEQLVELGLLVAQRQTHCSPNVTFIVLFY